jgi:hypothetical protein
MTPVPLELPVRPSDAAELAHLILGHAEGKPLTDDMRTRLASRAAAMKLETLMPWFGSLGRDPVHPSAYYLAVDAASGPALLLHIAIATAPTSSVFHKPLLIGRMRPVNSPEFVINAIPFAAGDRENIEKFAARVDTAFLPKPQGARASITVAQDLPGAFELFRRIQRRTGKNLAAASGDWHGAVWSAIRAGWRGGFSACHEVAAGALGDRAAFTRYAAAAASPAEAAQLHEQIRQARAAQKLAGAFEFDAELGALTATEFAVALDFLKTSGHAAHLTTVPLAAGELEEYAAIARRLQVTLSFRYAGEPAEVVAAAARATGGRVNFYAADARDAEFVVEHIL